MGTPFYVTCIPHATSLYKSLRLIEKYAAKAKLRNIPLTKVFSIGGTIGKNIKFCLATEAKLPQAKSAFDKILFTYTYSIQKGELTSFNSLYNSNYVQFKKEAQHSNEFSGIFCSTIRQRSAPVYISIVRAIFKRDLPQITIFQTSKSIFSYNFWAIIPKLSGYVLGM